MMDKHYNSFNKSFSLQVVKVFKFEIMVLIWMDFVGRKWISIVLVLLAMTVLVWYITLWQLINCLLMSESDNFYVKLMLPKLLAYLKGS
jgi:hypothetical protein